MRRDTFQSEEASPNPCAAAQEAGSRRCLADTAPGECTIPSIPSTDMERSGNHNQPTAAHQAQLPVPTTSRIDSRSAS